MNWCAFQGENGSDCHQGVRPASSQLHPESHESLRLHAGTGRGF